MTFKGAAALSAAETQFVRLRSLQQSFDTALTLVAGLAHVPSGMSLLP